MPATTSRAIPALHYTAGASNPDLTSRLLRSQGRTPKLATRTEPPRSTPSWNIRRTSNPEKPRFRTVDVLMRAGSDLNYQDKNGNTALHYLADGRIGGARQLTEALLQRGARTDIKNRQGLTPVDIASAERDGIERNYARTVLDAIERHQEQTTLPRGRQQPRLGLRGTSGPRTRRAVRFRQ